MVLRGAVLALAVGGWLAGCGGPSASSASGCRFDAWEGQCDLKDVRTVRVVERFPKSYVIVEALYEPKARPEEFAPPPFRKQLMTPAEYEQDLMAHVRAYPSVHCVVQGPIGDPCAPTMEAAVPEFVPKTGLATTVAEGCAKIERSGGSATLPASPVQLPGPFQFGEGSASETPDIQALADDAARAISKDPRIECVAIRGMSAPGEPFSLANDRAQAVRRLLEARGIPHTRVTVFEGTAPTYTASPDDQPVLSEHRRVHLSVVVYDNTSSNP